MRRHGWFGVIAVSGFAAILIGCGGGGGGEMAGGSGGSGGSGGGGSLEEHGTARVDINAETGAVTITPLGAPGENQSKSLYTGSAVSVTSSSLLTDPGETTVRKLRLSIKNNTGESIGAGSGAMLILDKLATGASGAIDLRQFTNVSTIIGPGSSANDGPPLSVTINQPAGIVRDTDGAIFVAGSGDGSLRVLRNGFVTRIGTGIATPGGVAVSGANAFLVEQTSHNLVRIPIAGGNKTVIAGNGTSGYVEGNGSTARFNTPRDIEIIGSTAYISDLSNNRIRTATNLTGNSATIATQPVSPSITAPNGIAHYNHGGVDYLVVTSTTAQRVYLVNLASGVNYTIAGTGAAGGVDGPGTTATFNSPFDATVANGAIYVADLGSRIVRQLMLREGALPQFASSWEVKTIAGTTASGATDGLGSVATFASPRYLETDGSGGLLLCDLTNNLVRKVNAQSGVFPVSGPGGTGTGTVSVVNPDGYVPDPGVQTNRKPMYQLDGIAPQATSSVDLTFALSTNVVNFSFIVSVSAESDTAAVLDAVNANVSQRGSSDVFVRTLIGGSGTGWVDGPPTQARIGGASYVHHNGHATYVGDSVNASVRRLGPDGNLRTIAGVKGVTSGIPTSGSGATCILNQPSALFALPNDLEIFVSDRSGRVLYYLSRAAGSDPDKPESWNVSIIAGTPNTIGNAIGDGLATLFADPGGVAADDEGRSVYLADRGNHCIYSLTFGGGDKSNPARWSSTYFAGSTTGVDGDANGNGTAAEFRSPAGIALSRSGDLFIGENSGTRIRRITSNRDVTILAGPATPQGTFLDGIGAAARMGAVTGIATDHGNYVYFGDLSHWVVRRVNVLTGEVKTVAGHVGGASDPMIDGPGNTAEGVVGASVTYHPKVGLIISRPGTIRQIERIVRNGQP